MFNKVILQGRIASEVKMEATSSGTNCCRVSIACQRSIKERDGSRGADFVPCVAFGQNAAFLCQYFTKGSSVVISGRLSVSNYEKNGQKMTYTNVVIESVDFGVGYNKEKAPAAAPLAPDVVTVDRAADVPEVLPFDF